MRGKEFHISTLSEGTLRVVHMDATVRLGTVPYLNAMPLTLPIEKKEIHSKFNYNIVKAPPSRLAHMIQIADLDVAMLSIVEPMRERRYRILDGISIHSNGPTLSVQIFHKGDPSQIKKLGLDIESKTSNILGQVILSEKYGIRPETIKIKDPDKKTLDDVDAFISIGDKTFKLLNSDMERFDLGETWKEITGLPVVFAVWVMAPHFKDRDIIDDLRRSSRLGLQMLDQIIPRIARTRDIPMEVLTQYFHKNVHFTLGTQEKKGVAKLFELANKIDIMPPPRKIEYFFG